VLVGRYGGAQLCQSLHGPVHVLAHHDGVVAAGKRVAGVDQLELPGGEQHRCGLAGSDRGGRLHRDPVHPGRVEGR